MYTYVYYTYICMYAFLTVYILDIRYIIRLDYSDIIEHFIFFVEIKLSPKPAGRIHTV